MKNTTFFHFGEIIAEDNGRLTLTEQDLTVDAALAGTGLTYVFEGALLPGRFDFGTETE